MSGEVQGHRSNGKITSVLWIFVQNSYLDTTLIIVYYVNVGPVSGIQCVQISSVKHWFCVHTCFSIQGSCFSATGCSALWSPFLMFHIDSVFIHNHIMTPNSTHFTKPKTKDQSSYCCSWSYIQYFQSSVNTLFVN